MYSLVLTILEPEKVIFSLFSDKNSKKCFSLYAHLEWFALSLALIRISFLIIQFD